ncbi:unnamed protein product [Blepharisma stoltei]|uniref:Uncharacterized protein n=1 Tax=Blepharisma stoltei TaxID=1481888 RepID=A0AAU9JCD0_9CILI|nr:unnamed protein product [Blepharisma stoltei]
MMELAIQDPEFGTAICSWFKLDLLQLAFLMSEYKKHKKYEHPINLRHNMQANHENSDHKEKQEDSQNLISFSERLNNVNQEIEKLSIVRQISEKKNIIIYKI